MNDNNNSRRNDALFNSIGRKHPLDDDTVYRVNTEKLELAMSIIAEMLILTDNGFYGMKLGVKGRDAVLTFKAGSFLIDIYGREKEIYRALSRADELTFAPWEGYMNVSVVIKDFWIIEN